MLGRKKNKDDRHNNTEITDKKSLKEIEKIAERLDDDEAVLEVAKQGRMNPGATSLTTPNTIFATDRRLIIRNPTMLGARQNVEYFDYDKITNIKLEKGVFSSTIVLSYPGQDKVASYLTWGREDDGEIKGLEKGKAENILQIVRNAIVEAKKESQKPVQVVQQASTADELAKLAKLHKDGVLSDKEFDKMKKDLISKM
tara:strand:+ start:93 stop:689 length:597 start_codon:yes stop_codon:yes gene_type:complete